jgi:iron complex outermembrane receptor protein
MRTSIQRFLPYLATAMAISTSAIPAYASDRGPQDYHLPAQSLDESLRSIGVQAGQNIVAPSSLLAGRRAIALEGRFRASQAVELLLAGTGLHVQRVGNTLVVRSDTEGNADGSRAGLDDPDIIVTGTRIRGSGPVGSSVITIDRKAIEASGYGTTQQIVQTLPQNFGGGPNEATAGVVPRGNSGLNVGYGSSVNLRGLGASSTLVLLNGNRPPLGGFSGVFADLSLIPAVAVERIEVLGDGASAIYGSDAVAGVVNVVPRTHFEGLETSFRYGNADGDAGELQASAIFGHKWSSGRLVIAYEYSQRDALSADDRDYATEDLRRFGGSDHRSLYAAPGTIVAGGTTFAIPAGQNGVGLAPARLVAGTLNRGDQWRGADLLPFQRRHALYANVEQTLTGGLSVYGELLVADRRARNRERATDGASVTVPVTNPFYVDPLGTGQPVQVRYAFTGDLGPESSTAHVKALGSLVGARLAVGSWSTDVHATYGVQQELSVSGNLVNTARLALALADTNPATAYNVFGDSHSTPQPTVDRIRGSSSTQSRYRLWSVIGRADGPLFDLPAGSVKLAVGSEYRAELFTTPASISDVSTLAPVSSPIDGLPGERRIAAVYGELLVPVFGDGARLPLMRKLDLSAAVRTEHYSDFGRTTNPKFGVSWEPVRDLTLRGTYGTSFRAPGFNDLRQGRSFTLFFPYPLSDPASPTGTTNALILRGNSPDIGPEKARTWTLGFDYRPAFLPGVHASATYFNIRYRNRIGNPSSELLTFLVRRNVFAGIINASPTPATIAAYYADPSFVNFFDIPASEVTTIIDARTQNLSVQHENGYDFDIGWAGDALGGRADIGINGTKLTRLDQALTATSQTSNVLDTLGNPVDLRLRGHAGWTGARLGVSAALNYVAGYANNSVPVPAKISSWTTVDLSLRYALPKGEPLGGLTFGLSATNIFDRDPPFAESGFGVTAIGYDPENANPLGRVIAFSVTKAW